MTRLPGMSIGLHVREMLGYVPRGGEVRYRRGSSFRLDSPFGASSCWFVEACSVLPNNYLRVAPGVSYAEYTSRAEAEWLSRAFVNFAGKPSLVVKMAKSVLARAGRRPRIRLMKPTEAHRSDRGDAPPK